MERFLDEMMIFYAPLAFIALSLGLLFWLGAKGHFAAPSED
ncbi:cytochrome bd oxidase small subunit CydS [Paenibacillus terricola]|nr:hypothetical protein [Paenibacillus terricola]